MKHESRADSFARNRLACALHAAMFGLVVAGGALLPSTSVEAAPQAKSANQSQRFDVPAGPLEEAINQFTASTGIRLSHEPADTSGLRSRGVSGVHDIRTALHRLLDGTGLRAVPMSDGNYALRKGAEGRTQDPSKKTTNFDAVEVIGTRPHSYIIDSTNSATGMNLSLRDTPQSVTVITRQRMDDGGITNLMDATRQAPGIDSAPSGNQVGGFAPLYARGYLVQSYILDGTPVSSDAIASSSIRGLAAIDSAAYEAVMVIRGATGLITGAGNPGAAVALTRKRPSQEFQASVTQSFGSWDQRRTMGDVGGPLNKAKTLSGRMVGSYDTGGDWRDGYQYEKYSGFGVLAADLTSNLQATLELDYGRDHGWGGAGGTGFPLVDDRDNPIRADRSTNPMAEWSYFRSRRIGMTAGLDYHLGEDWKAKVSYTHVELEDDSIRGNPRSRPPRPDGTFRLDRRRTQSENDSDSFNFKLDGIYELWGRKHELAVGLTSTKSNADTPVYQSSNSGNLNLYTWNRKAPEVDWSTVVNQPLKNETSHAGLYVSTRVRATEKLSVLAGTRWSNFSNHFSQAIGTTGTFYVQNLEEKHVFTPYFGVTYTLSRNFSPYVSYTAIFNPQSAQDVRGRTLDPEQGSNIEAGIKGEWARGRLSASAALFEVKRDNLAVRDGANQAPDGTPAYRAEDDVTGRG